MSCVKVLLVDDEPHIPMVVGRKLSSAGYEVITASDGEEGLAAANEFGPDLIITDLQMPYMSGAELAAALRADPSLRDIPVVLLTARGYVLSDEEREATNIKHFLSKPFSVHEILRVVEHILPGRSEAA
ncbi:MAG: response regulator [Planctomycetota bacterium]|nr:MAG: response regulator [Planctomycetota bacterium]